MVVEWGQYGVWSNCVLFCLVKMLLFENFYSDFKVEEGCEWLVVSCCIGILDDIVNMVLFMVSDCFDYINGGEVIVDGGLNMMIFDMILKLGGCC